MAKTKSGRRKALVYSSQKVIDGGEQSSKTSGEGLAQAIATEKPPIGGVNGDEALTTMNVGGGDKTTGSDETTGGGEVTVDEQTIGGGEETVGGDEQNAGGGETTHGATVGGEDGSSRVRSRKSKKRNGKGKAKRKVISESEDSEDDEDLKERFDFEIEEDVTRFVDELSIGRREIPESSSEDEDPMIIRNRRIRRGTAEDKLVLGQSFLTGVEFKETCLDYALKTRFNIKQEKYEPKRLAFKCGIGGNCKWRVYCSYDLRRQIWVIKSRYPFHSCTPNGYCNYLRSPVIARLFMDKLRLYPHFMPQAIQNHIKEQWKFVSSIGQCQRGRLKALKLIEKEHETQYAHIRGYAEEILDSNPGSVALVETVPNAAGEDVFNRFYVCFDVLRKCWRGSCRPILGLDGTFLKNAVKGCLLSAIGHDANNQIYPVAWAVVQSETTDNWVWFVKQLKEDLQLGDGSGFVMISDRGKGLITAVRDELPNAEHRACVKHIIENIKTKGYAGKELLKPLVWSLAWSYTVVEYREQLQKIKDYDLGLYNAVLAEKAETWSLAFYKLGSCCEDVDNNSTESFNATITKARTKSLIPMLETIRRQVMERIEKRRKKSLKHQARYSEYVVKILAEEKTDADNCTTYVGSHGNYEVYLEGQQYRVNIPRRTCSCAKWQITGIPCEHGYGAMISAGIDVEEHVHHIFSTFLWELNYDTNIIPMRGPKFWMHSGYGLVIAPHPPTPPGRKKGTKKTYPRIKGKHESPKKKSKTETLPRKGRIMHCSKCGEATHNAAKCPLFPKEKQPRKKKLKVGDTSSQAPETTSPTLPTQTSTNAL